MSLQPSHTFTLFSEDPDLAHGCFHRHGGVSPPPFASLNVSFGVGDDPHNVEHNRLLVKEALGCESLISSKQVHGCEVAVVEEVDGDCELEGYDALITNLPGVALIIQQADCQAVLLYDPSKKVIANVHCGWRGSVAGIITATVARMADAFACDPQDLQAAISPALGPCCAEFVNYQSELPSHLHAFAVKDFHFDFPAITSCQLQEVGIPAGNIENAGICTKCNPEWFSYRRNQITGRFCSAIALLP